jgi:hypothetical protein
VGHSGIHEAFSCHVVLVQFVIGLTHREGRT